MEATAVAALAFEAAGALRAVGAGALGSGGSMCRTWKVKGEL